MRSTSLLVASFPWLLPGLHLLGSEPEDYLRVVRAYADALLERGRDVYGSERSPLFASALDREAMSLLTRKPSPPEGIRGEDRTLTGSNPMHDENLYRLLYVLSELTGDERYARAADEALRFFLTRCQSEETGLFAWGEHLGWDFLTEAPLEGRDLHEFYRPWVLWEKCWTLAPEACRKFAKGLWEHQIADHETGNFSRHARYAKHGPGRDHQYPRHGGFYIATWAFAYSRTKDPEFLQAADTLLRSFARRREESGRFPQGSPRSDLSWAIDVWDAAALVPEDLGKRMRGEAQKTDAYYLRKFRKGLPKDPEKLWIAGYGDATTAMEAMICNERYRQTGSEEMRRLILEAAEAYLTADPPRDRDLYPGVFGEVIGLLVRAHSWTREEKYLRRADELAHRALETFFGEKPLPRASSRSEHYEAITRADTLALSLLELWSLRARPDRPLSFGYIDR